VLVRANSHFSQCVSIDGSDNADGRHEVAFGTHLDLQVRGAKWSLQTQFFPFGGPDWQAGDARRSTSFEPKNGLICRMEGATRPPGTGAQFNNLTLICSCLDLETNPIPTDNPYDFTLPG
jgi:hypothetical protein